MDLAWLANCDWCPPLLNLWTRRRLAPEPVGGSGVDIVSFGLFVCGDRFCAVRFVVLFLSVVLLLYGLLAWAIGSAKPLRSECFLIFFCFVLSAATDGMCLAVFFRMGCLFVFRVRMGTAPSR